MSVSHAGDIGGNIAGGAENVPFTGDCDGCYYLRCTILLLSLEGLLPESMPEPDRHGSPRLP